MNDLIYFPEVCGAESENWAFWVRVFSANILNDCLHGLITLDTTH